MPANNVMDPSEWMKPKQQRPARRSLYGALRKESNLKCLILTGLIYGCIVAIIWCRVTRVTKVDIDFTAFPITSTREISPCDDGSIYIPTAFVVMLYLLYLVECWHCKAWHQLKYEKTDLNSAYQKIHEIRQAQPVVWWKAVCYHYMRRTREITRYRNGNAYTCTQVYYERVNSHVAAGCFFFALCGMKDVSRELIELEKHAATKIQLSKGFLFANLATAKEFQEQRAAFFQEQERYDDYMEMREGMDLANVHFKESLISWASPDNPPWFAKAPVFWLCNFLLLSWPLRLILELNTAHVHYQVNKLFGVNYMSPSGSELLLSAPRSHGLPINNHQHRIHNRAISSHHSRLRSHHNRRRSVVAASEQPDQDDTAPLLFSGSHHDDGEQQQNQYLNQGNINKQEKDPSELQGSSKNLNKDQQTSGTNNNNTDTSPSSSSGRVFFPQWRNSFFTRNFRFAGQGGYKLTRSVTLLMTKPERLQFLASTQHQFPDEFGYYGDSDEGTRLLQDYESSYYPSCSSPPPPPFLTPSPSENQCTNVSDRRLTNHNHEEQRENSLVTRSNNSSGTNNNTTNNGCLAPSYSEALLLMEPNERHSVLPAYSSNEPNPPNSSLSPPPPSSSRANCDESGGNSSCDELGFPANLTNERDPSGFMGISGDESTSLANEASLDPTPVALPSRLHSQSNSGLNERAHYPHQNHHNNCPTGTITSATDEDHDDNAEAAGGDRDDNLQHSGNEVSLTRTRSSVAGSIGETSRHHHPAQQSCCVSNGHENDLYNSQERSASTTSSSRAQRQHTHHHHQSEDQPCSSSSASSVTSHYQRASTRLLSAGSSMVLNTVAPREMTGVQIDLTQPIVVTVPRDPLRESGTVDSSSSSYSMRSNAHRRFKNEADDQPPTYVEALRTSRPVFLPTLARIRRCFTERDIASRFSSNRSVWLDEITDVEGGRYNNTQRRSGTGQPNNSGGGGSTTSRV